MIIKKAQSTPIKANDNSTIWDYPMTSEEKGVSYQNLNGRLPEHGSYRNNVCHEIFFIISGKAQVCIDDIDYEVESGDIVILEPGQKHFGNYNDVAMITLSSPNWYEDQCEAVDD